MCFYTVLFDSADLANSFQNVDLGNKLKFIFLLFVIIQFILALPILQICHLLGQLIKWDTHCKCL